MTSNEMRVNYEDGNQWLENATEWSGSSNGKVDSETKNNIDVLIQRCAMLDEHTLECSEVQNLQTK